MLVARLETPCRDMLLTTDGGPYDSPGQTPPHVTAWVAPCRAIRSLAYGSQGDADRHDDRCRAPCVLRPGSFQEAVLAAVARAKAAVPAAESRIDTAAALCSRARWSCWRRDGRPGWAARRTGAQQYVVNGQCPCPDFPTAPGHLCTHRLAYGIAKRATELLQAPPTPLPAPSDQGAWGPSDALDDLSAEAVEADPGDTGLPPEQSATATLPQETAPLRSILQLIDGKPFVKYAGLLTMAHAQGLQQLEAWFTGVSDTLAVAQATATFRDGRRFSESGEATPENVGAGCGRTLPAWRSPGPRLAVSGMPSILPYVRSRSWGRNPRTACCGAPGPGSGWERESASWDEARTPAIQHTHGFSAMRGSRSGPASLMWRALLARLRPTSAVAQEETRGGRRWCTPGHLMPSLHTPVMKDLT